MRLLRSLILAFLFLNIPYINAQESHDFEISKNLDIYTSLIQQLDLHYVDEMHAGTMTKTAIDGISYRNLELSILRIAHTMAKLEKSNITAKHIEEAIVFKDRMLRKRVGEIEK